MSENLCSDCGFAVSNMGPEAIARGSSVRDPGEALCTSCLATRSRMIQELAKIPSNLRAIRALRMVRV